MDSPLQLDWYGQFWLRLSLFVAELPKVSLLSVRHIAIYEVMVNGSLEEWLHPTQTIGETNQRPKSLTFSQRLNIVIDVAMTLDYMHHHCQTPIVHCDLKPSNVLLNDDMTGHVGDFGLARFLPKTFDGNHSSSIGVKGTIGYTPPGKRPTDKKFQGTSNLRNLVKGSLHEEVIEIADPVLVQEKEGEMNGNNRLNEASIQLWIKIEESLVAILEIGVACSSEIPRERLDIGDAMVEMCRIRNTPQANRIYELIHI